MTDAYFRCSVVIGDYPVVPDTLIDLLLILNTLLSMVSLNLCTHS